MQGSRKRLNPRRGNANSENSISNSGQVDDSILLENFEEDEPLIERKGQQVCVVRSLRFP